ncbi:hypothetical protein AT6N2_C2571 [Agrobacterium tumefaciens]|nr:hypothetical protein AT6N2_C2571 [Agrobacterium tumefaciens]
MDTMAAFAAAIFGIVTVRDVFRRFLQHVFKSLPPRIERSPQRESARSSRFAEAISYAIKRFNHIEVAIDQFELLAKALDVAVDGTVVDIDLFVISGIHQRVAAFDNAWPLRQRMQDEEFGHRERHRLTLPGAGVTLLVHGELPAFQRARLLVCSRFQHAAGCSGCFAAAGAAKDRLDALHQKALREGLGDEIVRAHLQAEQFVDLFILGGEEDNRQIRFLAKAPQKLHAVHAWHLDVKNGELRRTGNQPVERGSPIRIRFDPVALGFKRDRYRSQNIPVVVD